MPSTTVTPDGWTPLIPDRLRFFLRADPLIDADYAPALDFGIDPDHQPGVELLEVRTRASMPAGWRLQFVYDRRLYLPALEARLSPVDTTEFRRNPEEYP